MLRKLYPVYFICLFVFTSSQISAQVPKVQFTTFSAVRNDTIVQHLDTFQLYYSNGRGGFALPEFLFNYQKQPLFFDSSICLISGKIYRSNEYKTYDAQDNVIQHVLQNYYWGRTDTVFYTYNANSQVTSKISFNWSANFLSGQRELTTYNTGGQIVSYEKGTAKVYGTWNNSTKVDYIYNGTDLTEIKEYVWNNLSSMYELKKHTINYYTSAQPDSSYVYGFSSSSKISLNKHYYSYTGLMVTMVERQFFSDTSNMSKFGRSRNTLTYNSGGKLTVNTLAMWDTANSVWENREKYETIYNAQGDPDTLFYAMWDANNSAFRNDTRTMYYYHANNFLTYGQTQYKIANAWGDPNDLTDTTIVYHYDTIAAPLSIKLISSLKTAVNIFPNPAVSVVNIHAEKQWGDLRKVAIYDMSGRLQLQQSIPEGKSNFQLPVAALPAGNYMLYISGATMNVAKQITIVK